MKRIFHLLFTLGPDNKAMKLMALSFLMVLTSCVGLTTLESTGRGESDLAISSQPQSLSLTEGANANLTVTAFSQNTISYQWYKDSTLITGATSSTYPITSATSAYNGSYYVIVTDGYNTIQSSSAVVTVGTVTSSPLIATQPTNVTAVSGGSASFSVVATGGALTYQWYRNGYAIAGATSAVFTITSVNSAYAGNYYVVITNAIGSLQSNTVALTVSDLPVILTQPASVTVPRDDAAVFSVSVSGQNLTYQWYKDGAEIGGAYAATFAISAVTDSDAGAYYVIITNEIGSVTSSTATLAISN